MQSDTLNIIQSETSGIGNTTITNNSVVDTQKYSIRSQIVEKQLRITPKKADSSQVQADSIVADTLHAKEISQPENSIQLFDLFPSLKQSSDSSVINITDKSLLKTFSVTTSENNNIKPLVRQLDSYNGWVAGLAFIILALLIYIQLYFQKYLSSITASLYNLQLAEKLMREKNVLIRRVFFILNTIFLLTSSLYIFSCFRFFDVQLPFKNSFLVYIIIVGISLTFMLIRLLVQRAIGFLFESKANFNEYIHNTFLLNKNLGIYLLPLIISLFFLKLPYANIVFYICTGIVIIWLLYRYIRATQIIIKQKVFLFYSILYLCTLEILPAFVGIKFILSLR